jgi:hypothetical protein
MQVILVGIFLGFQVLHLNALQGVLEWCSDGGTRVGGLEETQMFGGLDACTDVLNDGY